MLKPRKDIFAIPKTMQAMVYRGVDDLRLETVPVPRIGPKEVLVKVAVCGVCPTDIKKITLGTQSPPRIYGHETAGTIVRLGALVRGFRIGDRVALHHHVPCLHCHACRHRSFAQCPQYKRTGITAGFEPAGGGYAEYVRVMPFVLPGMVKIPARNSFEEGAMLEPVNTVLKAVLRLQLLKGDVVLVIGQGPIGLMFTRILRIHGLKVIAADLMPFRLAMAKRYGAAATFGGADLRMLPETLGHRVQSIDGVVVTAASDEAVIRAQSLVRRGGKILLFAHTTRGGATPLDLSQICVDEVDMIGSYSADFTLQSRVASLVFSRRIPVERLVTHRFSLGHLSSAVELARRPRHESLKVAIVQGGVVH